MRRVRRIDQDVRIEITPMIDVVFLLLTFFVFSIVLMVRADVLDVRLPELGSGAQGDAVVPITVAITEDGLLLVNREPVEQETVVEHLQSLRESSPGAPIVLAVDTRSQSGAMIELVDRLTGAGIDSFSIIGKRKKDDESGSP